MVPSKSVKKMNLGLFFKAGRSEALIFAVLVLYQCRDVEELVECVSSCSNQEIYMTDRSLK